MDELNENVRFKADGWYNNITGIGITNIDRRMHTKYELREIIQINELTAIYRTEGIGTRIVNEKPNDMIRRWFTIEGDTDNIILKILNKMNAKKYFREALIWDRLYGGSVILLFVNDGKQLDEPVNENSIVEVSGMQVFESFYVIINPNQLYDDPTKPEYGKPKIYNITIPTTGKLLSVHESRLLIFDGELLPSMVRIGNNYWGDSCLQSIYDRLRGLGDGYASSETLLMEMIIGIFKVKGLASFMSNKDGRNKMLERMSALDLTRHTINSYLLDENEEYTRMELNGSGISGIMDILIEALIMVSGYPRVKLLGEQSKGLGGEAAGSLRLYYDQISAMQEEKLQKPLEKLIKYISLSQGLDYEELQLKFNPLWEMSESEVATLRKTQAETDNIYFQMGLPAEIILKSRFGGSSYSMETIIPEEYIEYLESKIMAENEGIEPESEPEPESEVE